jgi:hypothetical protein
VGVKPGLMHVFVESNFVLELAFRQSEYEVCERIRQGAKAAAYVLYLPQYALAEVFEKLRPLRNRRDEYRRYLLEEIAQHRREDDSDATKMDDLTQALTTLLEERTQQQTQRLHTVASELAQEATALVLSPPIIEQAYSVAQVHNLSPQDGLVYASVLAGMRQLPQQAPKLFISRNKDDFGKPSIRAELQSLGCEYLASFRAAAGKLGV